jgi:hypothetical protein
MAQITSRAMKEKSISKVSKRLTMVTSASISQRPLVIKNMLSSFFDLRADCRKADVPDKKTNTGAQKCVIHLVK